MTTVIQPIVRAICFFLSMATAYQLIKFLWVEIMITFLFTFILSVSLKWSKINDSSESEGSRNACASEQRYMALILQFFSIQISLIQTILKTAQGFLKESLS